MKNLDEFISRLVEEKGFNTKEVEVIDQIKADLMSRVEDRINAMIISNLDVEVLPEFEAIIDAGDESKVEAFVKKNIPDIDEKLAAELLAFKSMYLS